MFSFVWAPFYCYSVIIKAAAVESKTKGKNFALHNVKFTSNLQPLQRTCATSNYNTRRCDYSDVAQPQAITLGANRIYKFLEQTEVEYAECEVVLALFINSVTSCLHVIRRSTWFELLLLLLLRYCCLSRYALLQFSLDLV